MLMDMWLLTFDIYQGSVTPNYFKNHTNSRCPNFSQKILSDVHSEVGDNAFAAVKSDQLFL